MSAVGRVTFTLFDEVGEPVKIACEMPDGRKFDLLPIGDITRREARVVCGGIMGAMRAGIRSDQFRHGEVLKEAVR